MGSKALVPVTKESWDAIQAIAPVAQASRMFGTTAEQAAIVMLKGHELGLGLASSFEFIHVIDQKPSIAPKGALALIHGSGELEGLKIDDRTDSKGKPTECTVWMKRTNGFEYTVTFTMADAERAGLTKKGSGWEKYPANMLRWRAIGYCADIVFPDVIGGMYRPEELGATVNEEGAPIEGTWTVATETVTLPLPADAQVTVGDESTTTIEEQLPTFDLASLMERFGAEAVMSANSGKIPTNENEFKDIFAVLEAARVDEEERIAVEEAVADEG